MWSHLLLHMRQLQRRSFSALKDKSLPIEASPSFSVSTSPPEQLTFRSLADEMFIFLATFGKFPAIFQDFDAFIFINSSRRVAEPLDGSRNVKRFSIVPDISTRLMPIHQPNPNRSGV